MLRTTFTLIAKKQLTHDVYELVYSCPELTKEPPKPGQYVMFQLAPGLNRAYSLASSSLVLDNIPFEDSNTSALHSPLPTFTLIIKRVTDGRGSPMICDAEVGTVFSGMIPLGHFTLQDTPVSKCFIGTGTGFAPLYYQMTGSLALDQAPMKTAFIFGVRNFSDSFYEDEIESFQTRFSDFQYVQYFSRETDFSNHQSLVTSHQSGYVTDWITTENISGYEEFYICGSPAMVKDARAKLESLGIEKERVFWEQF